MYNTYKEQQTEAVLLVDASNAFSLVKRKTPLHNIGIICPSIVNCVRNCQNFPPRLFIIGGGNTEYTERATQGDPTFAIVIYAFTIIPLILLLVNITHQDDSSTKTAAYEDNFTQQGKSLN